MSDGLGPVITGAEARGRPRTYGLATAGTVTVVPFPGAVDRDPAAALDDRPHRRQSGSVPCRRFGREERLEDARDPVRHAAPVSLTLSITHAADAPIAPLIDLDAR
jgi:hypothetical protein